MQDDLRLLTDHYIVRDSHSNSRWYGAMGATRAPEMTRFLQEAVNSVISRAPVQCFCCPSCNPRARSDARGCWSSFRTSANGSSVRGGVTIQRFKRSSVSTRGPQLASLETWHTAWYGYVHRCNFLILTFSTRITRTNLHEGHQTRQTKYTNDVYNGFDCLERQYTLLLLVQQRLSESYVTST